MQKAENTMWLSVELWLGHPTFFLCTSLDCSIAIFKRVKKESLISRFGTASLQSYVTVDYTAKYLYNNRIVLKTEVVHMWLLDDLFWQWV